MKRTHLITWFIALCLAVVVQPGFAQHEHSGHQQTPPPTDQMPQQHMMSMNEMMQHMQNLVSMTSDMMKTMHEMGGHEGMGQMQNQQGMGQMQGHEAMMGMNHSLSDMAKDMQKFMEQMQQAMKDKAMMKDAGMKKHMEEMQKNMGSMMQGMDGVVKNMNSLQEGQKKSE